MQNEARDPVDFRIATIARNQLLIAVEETDPLRDVVDCRLERNACPSSAAIGLRPANVFLE
jgi:hypothetical protein